MSLSILYRPNTEHERKVLDFARDFKMRNSREIELVSLDTVEGAEKAKVYGVMQYPAILAVGKDGKMLKMWEGDDFPLMDEVLGYELS